MKVTTMTFDEERDKVQISRMSLRELIEHALPAVRDIASHIRLDVERPEFDVMCTADALRSAAAYEAIYEALKAKVGEVERDSAMPFGFVKPDTEDQVFFYEQDFYVLSNFSAFSILWKGHQFATSEAAYHWEKFPQNSELQLLILKARSAHEAFKIAERNKAYRRLDWEQVRVGIMRALLRAKVQQHEYVMRKLLATGDRELIEDSWRDDFWGWGPNRDGQNVLGKLWMEIRAELRGQTPAEATEALREGLRSMATRGGAEVA